MGLLTTRPASYDAIRTSFQVSGACRSRRASTPTSPPWQASWPTQFTADGIDLGERDLRAARRSALCRPGLRAASAVPRRHASTQARWPRCSSAFHEAHRSANTAMHFADSPIEIVNMRLIGVGHMPPRSPSQPTGTAQSLDDGAGRDRRTACSASTASSPTIETDFYRRDLLPVGADASPGPPSSCRRTSTTVVPPRLHAFRSRRGRQSHHHAREAR